jgi:surfeit locus 1 family protein
MRSKVWLLPLTLAAAALTASLGVWQMQRASTKQALAAARDAASLRPPLLSLHGAEEFRVARLKGEWQPAHQLWLANRSHDRQSGFVLVTPMRLVDGRWLWVQRGFHPRAQGNFDAPPWPATPSGPVEVQGRLARNASQAFSLGQEAREGPVRQNLDPAVAPRSEVAMAPWVLWQLQDCAPLRCDWPAVESGVAKHHGYAAQWFALSGLTLGLYVWFQLLPHWRQRRA